MIYLCSRITSRLLDTIMLFLMVSLRYLLLGYEVRSLKLTFEQALYSSYLSRCSRKVVSRKSS